jgi:hypothetical protein
MAPVEVVIKALRAVDEDAADVLVRSALVDAYSDALGDYLDDVSKIIEEWQSEAMPLVKREFIRNYVSMVSKGVYPSQEWVDSQLGVLEIVKAQEQWTRDGSSVMVDVRRDARGRFSRSTSNVRAGTAGLTLQGPNQQGRPRGRLVAPAGAGGRLEMGGPGKQYLQMSEAVQNDEGRREQTERYLGAYKEAQKLQDELKAAFGNDAKSVRLVQQIEDLQSGAHRLESIGLDELPADWDPTSEQQTALLFDADPNAPEDVKQRVQRANTAGGMLGTAGVRAATSPDELNALVSSLKPDYESSPSKRRYNQVSRLGSAVERMAPGSTAATVLQQVGSRGEQYQEALGPYMERAAYRFRGTQTRLDPGMVNTFDTVMADFDAKASSDSERMAHRRDAAGQALLEKIPADRNVAELARRSGRSLPSQGVLIDSDGDLVSQSVGVGPDHYVPFDLKSMKALNGGQYVRTRVLGGLTPEDIHAVLVGNGRAASVVSASGRFEIELDPDLRGQRRFNDKVLSMGERYERILDAVADSGMYVQDLPADVMAQIDEQASMYPAGSARNQQRDRLLEQKRSELSRVTTQERESAIAEVDAQFASAPGGSAQQRAAARNDAIEMRLEELQAQKVRQLRLNHEGYKLALETLKEQFPHAIRSVSATTIDDFAPKEGAGRMNRYRSRQYARDEGYVGPTSGNRPRAEAQRKEKVMPGRSEPWRYYEQKPPGSASSGSSASGAPSTAAPTAGETPGAPAGDTATVPRTTPLGAALAQAQEKARPQAAKALAAWSGQFADAFRSGKDTEMQAMAIGGGAQTVAAAGRAPSLMARLLLTQGANTDRANQIITELADDPTALALLDSGKVAESVVSLANSAYDDPSGDGSSGAHFLLGITVMDEPDRKVVDKQAYESVQQAMASLASLARQTKAAQWMTPPADITSVDGEKTLAFADVAALPNGKAANAYLAQPAIKRVVPDADQVPPAQVASTINQVRKIAASLSDQRIQDMQTTGTSSLTPEEEEVVSTATNTPPSQAFAQVVSGGFKAALPGYLTTMHQAKAAMTARDAFVALGMGGEETGPKVPEVLGKRLGPSLLLGGLPVLPSHDPRVEAVRKGLATGVLRPRRRR